MPSDNQQQIADSILSKRELIAAMALQGLLANPDGGQYSVGSNIESAITYADELLKELDRKKQ